VSERDDWRRPLDAPADPEQDAAADSDGAGERRPSGDSTTPTWPSAPPVRSFERAETPTTVDERSWRTYEAPPEAAGAEEGDGDEDGFHHPLDRVTGRLPRTMRIVVDWVVTIVGAIAIVLAIKAWVVNPYRIPSSSMEPTLHCARPATGCEARFSDRVLANRFIYHFRDPGRGDVVVFDTPERAQRICGAGGTFVKRIVGLPGERLELRISNGAAFVFIDGRKLDEPYVEQQRRDGVVEERRWTIPEGQYFVMGDNRSQSCDSTKWGPLPRDNIIGKVFMTYWPPNRISFR
jgi:signal peptidase I